MDSRRKHIIFFLSSLGLIILFWTGCKPKKQEIPPIISLTLDVKDNKKVPVVSATAYLYESQEDYDKAYQNSLKGIYSANGAKMEGQVSNGKLTFKDVPSNKEYWILVVDKSSVFVDKKTGLATTIPICKDNTEAQFYVSAFQNGTEVFANITLQPVNALIKFEGTEINSIDTKTIGKSYLDVINLSDYVEVRKGAVPYFLRNTLCAWTGEVNATGGEVVYQNIITCARKVFRFKAEASNFTNGGEVHIYIGQNATKPSLILTDGNTKEIALANEVHDYTYFAKHTLYNCVWQGEAKEIEENILPSCR